MHAGYINVCMQRCRQIYLITSLPLILPTDMPVALAENIRKVQQSSNKSVFFYIPKDMLRELELNKGDYVRLTKRGTKISFEKYEP